MTSSWLHRFALLTAVATLALLGLGGLVTSHGVGMAVPDWPNTYGYNMFFFPVSQWVGGIFYEHTHRLLASGVGLLTAILALWLHGNGAKPFLRWSGLVLLCFGIATPIVAHAHWADGVVLLLTGSAAFAASWFWPRGEPSPKWLRRLGVAAFVAVVLQGILGGLRVVLFKDQIGIFHATLAQLFFALLCALALFTSRWWQGVNPSSDFRIPKGRLPFLFAGATLLILCQLILGATMRHQHAGLAIPDFPLAYGKFWPSMTPESVAQYNQQRIEITALNPITAFQIGLQLAHRFVAILIFGAVLACAWSTRRQLGDRHFFTRVAWLWLGLILTQVVLGAATIWSNKAADLATAHVVVGALSLALGANASIVLFRKSVFVRGLERSAAATSVAVSPTFGSRPAPVVGLE
jgi:cytochrome c oxidase assembly protein subunit 15